MPIYPFWGIIHFMDYLISTPEQLASAVKGRRKTLRVTQAAAAARVGLLPKTVSALESKPEKSSLESLFKLLAALDLELVVRPKDKAAAPPRVEW